MNNTSQAYFPAADVHKKQQTLTNQSEWSQTFHLGEIRRCGYILLRFDKLRPISAQSPLGIRNDAVYFQNMPNRCRTDIVSHETIQTVPDQTPQVSPELRHDINAAIEELKSELREMCRALKMMSLYEYCRVYDLIFVF